VSIITHGSRESPGPGERSTRAGKARLVQRILRAPGASGLSLLRKALLMDLAFYANADGWAWPSVATLAAHVDKTPRAVQKNLQWLVGAGFIERRIRPGRGHTNEYRLLVDLASKLPGEKVNAGSRFETENVNAGSGFDRGKGEPGSREKANPGSPE